MSSLRDQLLKAGLVTEDQVKKAETKPKRGGAKRPSPHAAKKKVVKKKPKRELSDLEKFYQERSTAENKERQQAKRAKEEAARLKKERNVKISKLINENILNNDDDACERYNFVIGTAVKYAYVTPEQLEQLANGQLALSFLKGKCRVISIETAEKIREIDDKRLLIQQKSI
ncbi:MAG TPA: DUF2058 family protein [Leucothrix mucor]|nr:DUF2058 family protein [Leucothrix mucor]